MKIFQWPWKKNKEEIKALQSEVIWLKNALEKARVLKFVKIITYEKGMNLDDNKPDPISLKKLSEDIETLVDRLDEIESSMEPPWPPEDEFLMGLNKIFNDARRGGYREKVRLVEKEKENETTPMG